MSTNSLGNFTFVSLHNPGDPGAPPLLPAMEGELVQRAGVDGSSVQKLGLKGRPFQMRSAVDCLTFDAANDQLADYMSAQNAEPLVLVWGSVNYQTSYQALYLPLQVEPIRIRRVTGCVGGLLGGTGGAWLEALWTLLPIREDQ